MVDHGRGFAPSLQFNHHYGSALQSQSERETVRNSSGSYDSTSPTNTLGSYSSLSGISGLVTSSYIFSVVVENGGGSFAFTPSATIVAGSAYIRGTGGITVVI